MSKPTWDTYFLQLALLAATRATCARKQVGAVIVTPHRRVLSTGYNGAPAGMPSCDEVGHLISDGHCTRSLHAESNALDFAGREARGCTMFCTASPCWDCAKRIVNAGISRVAYGSFYASRYGLSDEVPRYFKDAGIECVQIDTPGLALFQDLLPKMVSLETEALRVTLVKFDCGCEVPYPEAGRLCLVHEKPQVA